MSRTAKFAAALRHGDPEVARQQRYALAGDGTAIALRGYEFAGINLTGMPLDYLVFTDCMLTGATFGGTVVVALAFVRCDLRGADLRALDGMIDVVDCDLRGAVLDAEKLGSGPKRILPSCFAGCQLDVDTATALRNAGVLVVERTPLDRLGFYNEVRRHDAFG